MADLEIKRDTETKREKEKVVMETNIRQEMTLSKARDEMNAIEIQLDKIRSRRSQLEKEKNVINNRLKELGVDVRKIKQYQDIIEAVNLNKKREQIDMQFENLQTDLDGMMKMFKQLRGALDGENND